MNRKVASEILTKAGCVVETADSGRKAIELVEKGERRKENGEPSPFSIFPSPFDLILMDIQMPDLDGVETTQELRRRVGAALPPVVAMTAYSMKEDRDRFLSQGLNDYVAKPIRAEALVRKVKEWMDVKGQIAPVPAARPTSTAPAAEPVVPVFDREVVNQLRELGGVEMVVSVFEDFEGEAAQQLADAQAAYQRADHAAVESNLHTLKGNAGTLGVERLHQAVKSLEARTKVGDFSTFETEMPLVVREFATFREQYKRFLEGL